MRLKNMHEKQWNMNAKQWIKLLGCYSAALLLVAGFSVSAAEASAADESAAQAADEPQKVEVRVDGMSCMFCAYSLERKFSDLEFVEELEINVREGILSFRMPSDTEFSDEDIEKRVTDAGFTFRKIKRE